MSRKDSKAPRADKQPLQADGGGHKEGSPDGVSTPGSGRKGSESSGSAYPAPKGPRGKFGSHGGQSQIGYHGPTQLGDDVFEENPNAVSRD